MKSKKEEKKENTLKIKAVPGKMVRDHDKLKIGIVGFIGYKLINNEWVIIDDGVDVADTSYIRRALDSGDLIKNEM